MIHVPADVDKALNQRNVSHVLRVRWTLNDGQVIDLSDRVKSVGSVRRYLEPFMLGHRLSSTGVTLHNVDKLLSANASPDISIVSYRGKEELMGSRVTIEDGIVTPTQIYYLPVFSGFLQTLDYAPGLASMKLINSLQVTLNKPLPESFVVDPALTASAQIQTLLTDFTPLTTSDLDTTGTFAFAADVQEDLDWTVSGIIPQNQILQKAVNDLARSGFGTVYADEEGTIVYETEFPATSGEHVRHIQTLPHHVTELNADQFLTGLAEQLVSTECTVKYQNVEASHRDKSLEPKLGRVPALVNAPYLFFYRCARQMARVCQAMGSNFMDAVNFTTPSYGLVFQLNDRVRVTDPIDDRTLVYRIMHKTWTTGGLAFGCIRERHLDDFIDGTFGEWGVTDWSSTTANWW